MAAVFILLLVRFWIRWREMWFDEGAKKILMEVNIFWVGCGGGGDVVNYTSFLLCNPFSHFT